MNSPTLPSLRPATSSTTHQRNYPEKTAGTTLLTATAPSSICPPTPLPSIHPSYIRRSVEGLPAATAATPPLEPLVAAPPPYSDLPLAGGKVRYSRAAALREKLQNEEAADAVYSLQRREERQRAALRCREWEARHEFLWACERESALLRCKEDCARLLSTTKCNQERAEMALMQAAVESLLSIAEPHGRDSILREERQAFRFFGVTFATCELEVAARKLQQEHASAKAFADEAAGVRELECDVVRRSFHPQKPFTPFFSLGSEASVTSLFFKQQSGSHNMAASTPRVACSVRTSGLISGAVKTEEMYARCCLNIEEQMKRLEIEHRYITMRLVLEEEPNARREVEGILRWVSYPTCLRAVLTIQRWWRMSMNQPWSRRRRVALQQDIHRVHIHRTAAEYHHRLRLMEARAIGLPLHGPTDFSTVTKAATDERRYRQALREYTFGLSQLHKCCFYDLVPPVGGIQYDLRHLPYLSWRRCRWFMASYQYQIAVGQLGEEEAIMRCVLEAAAQRDSISLTVFHMALQSGATTVQQLCRDVEIFGQEEERSRDFLVVQETYARSGIEEDHCNAWESLMKPQTSLLAAAEEGRLAIVAEEAASRAGMVIAEHPWWELSRYRQCLVEREGFDTLGTAHSKKFVSPDSAARVLQRFQRYVALCNEEERHCRLVPGRRLRAAQHGWRQALLILQRTTADREVPCTEDHADPLCAPPQKWRNAGDIFGQWMETTSLAVQQEPYDVVAKRFYETNQNLFQQLRHLSQTMQSTRPLVADEETMCRQQLYCSPEARVVLRYQLQMVEDPSRQQIAHQQMVEKARVLSRVYTALPFFWWSEGSSGGVATELRPTTSLCQELEGMSRLAAHKQRRMAARAAAAKAIPIPSVGAMQRLMAREDVCRTTIFRESFHLLGEILYQCCSDWMQLLLHKSDEDVAAKVSWIDQLYPAHLPIAQLLILQRRESDARAQLEHATLLSFTSPMLRGHNAFGAQVLWPSFLFGHLKLVSESNYMDNSLTRLLTMRVGHVSSKLKDLEDLECSARSRVEYTESITRDLRFVYQRLRI